MISTLIFWFIAGLVMVSGLMVALRRNVLHAAFAMCLTFAGVAGLYIMLGSPFLAAVQLIIYVGGVVILVIFAVMFSSRSTEDSRDTGHINMTAGVLSLVMMLGVCVSIILYVVMPRYQYGGARSPERVLQQARDSHALLKERHGRWIKDGRQGSDPLTQQADKRGSINPLAAKLLSRYVVPFELAALLLVAVLVGALVIVRKEIKGPGER